MAFGEHYPGQANPLDGFSRMVDVESGTFKYFMKLVPTTYISPSGACPHHLLGGPVWKQRENEFLRQFDSKLTSFCYQLMENNEVFGERSVSTKAHCTLWSIMGVLSSAAGSYAAFYKDCV